MGAIHQYFLYRSVVDAATRFRERFRKRDVIAQRIVVRYHLGGLARDELPEYLDHRLRLAGTSLPLFEPGAVQALYQATHGLPRKVNRIAHYALSAAALASCMARCAKPE